MHLVLVARRRELMESLAQELHTAHGTKCEIIVSDLGDTTEPPALYDDVKRRKIKVSLLINNAGFGHVGQILETDVNRIHELLRLNIEALTDLTYRFLPDMIAAGEGGIINVSSVAAFQPVAYMGVYAASKAYVLHFSEALWAEAWDYGVTVMALCPGTTRTAFFDISGVKGWLNNKRAPERRSGRQDRPQSLRSTQTVRRLRLDQLHAHTGRPHRHASCRRPRIHAILPSRQTNRTRGCCRETLVLPRSQ
jgi:short-subunit dehydrogenase